MRKKDLGKNGGKKMKTCEDCGKKLGVFHGYIHPTLGKDYLLCSKCFDKVSESVDQWREFVNTNSFNTETPYVEIPETAKDLASKVRNVKSLFKTVKA